MSATLMSSLTTLRVGGPVSDLVQTTTEADFLAAIEQADADGAPLLVIGGGSNVLVADQGFEGIVVRDGRSELTVQDDGACGGVSVTVTAGMRWDDVVARAVSEGWVGIEALSGIPGSTGATPVQNVGAYGAEVSQVIATVRVWDRHESRVRTLARAHCEFGYRDSLLKRSMRSEAPDGHRWHPTPRYVVLDVTMQMRVGTLSAPVAYAQLASALGVAMGQKVPLAQVREAVLELRASKGMVLDPNDADTWSAGSFFTNPVVSADAVAALPDHAPRFPAGDGAEPGAVKISAAWLIENAGFGRGFGLTADARATLSTKHTLALTNRGDATATDLIDLARAVREGVREAYGICLVPEPVLIGVEL